MATQMQKVISNCKQCIQHEGTQAKVPMQPIITSAPLELLHVDFTSIETTMDLDQQPLCGEYFGLLQSLYKTCRGLCDP